MNDKEILNKAVDKAIANGWKYHFLLEQHWDEISKYMIPIEIASFMIIFDHSFAKAFFINNPYWHLQQMVIEDSPIKYLERFL